MSARIRKSMMAGAIAALISAPVWAQGEAGSPGATGSPGAGMSSQSASSPLYSMTPQQLRRMEVVDATGENIGSVRSVVRSRDQENIQLVVSSGGFLGVGGKETTIPLDQVNLAGDKIQLSSTKAELEGQPEYQPEQYVELEPADQPISDFAAFEPTPGQEEAQPGMDAGRTGEPGMGTTSPGEADRPMGTTPSPGSEGTGSPGTMER